MKLRALFSLALLLGFGCSSVHATLLGLDASPLGNRALPAVGYAMWDFFPTTSGGTGTLNFSNHLATIESGTTGVGTTTGASGGTLFSATLTSTMNGTRAGSGARLLSGFGPTPNPYAMTINGAAAGDISTFNLQWKYTAPSVGTAEDFFDITLTVNGIDVIATPAPVLLGSSVESSTFNIYEWTWTDLEITAGDTFSFSITSGADHVSSDAISLDAVPEPSIWLLVAGALGSLCFGRRRRPCAE